MRVNGRCLNASQNRPLMKVTLQAGLICLCPTFQDVPARLLTPRSVPRSPWRDLALVQIRTVTCICLAGFLVLPGGLEGDGWQTPLLLVWFISVTALALWPSCWVPCCAQSEVNRGPGEMSLCAPQRRQRGKQRGQEVPVSVSCVR